MSGFNRRELLQCLSIIAPTLLLAGTNERDYFREELVCVHVYDPKGSLPEPLLTVPEDIPQRFGSKGLFQIGLPEVALCSAKRRLLEVFSFFWPVSREEMRGLESSTKVLFQRQILESRKDIDDLVQFLRNEGGSVRADDKTLALTLTLNDQTRYYTPSLIEACRYGGIEELVIFKDPSRPPYLCRHPSLQKGFKRPPPI